MKMKRSMGSLRVRSSIGCAVLFRQEPNTMLVNGVSAALPVRASRQVNAIRQICRACFTRPHLSVNTPSDASGKLPIVKPFAML